MKIVHIKQMYKHLVYPDKSSLVLQGNQSQKIIADFGDYKRQAEQEFAPERVDVGAIIYLCTKTNYSSATHLRQSLHLEIHLCHWHFPHNFQKSPHCDKCDYHSFIVFF